MKLYRLKKEAVPFFKKDEAARIYPIDIWDSLKVDIEALEVVEEMYINYGIKTSKIASDLGGWDEDGSHFHFTIVFPSVKYCEHDKFTNGKMVRNLMDKIQNQINYFYQEFVNN